MCRKKKVIVVAISILTQVRTIILCGEKARDCEEVGLDSRGKRRKVRVLFWLAVHRFSFG
jgi:hypothetical protein